MLQLKASRHGRGLAQEIGKIRIFWEETIPENIFVGGREGLWVLKSSLRPPHQRSAEDGAEVLPHVF